MSIAYRATLVFSLWSLLVPSVSIANDTLSAPRFGSWGVDLEARDSEIKPGDDFFAYANGNFVKNAEIPPDRSRFGNFDALSILSQKRVHQILEEATESETPDTRKIGALYASYMDEELANKLGVTPIRPDLDAIQNASDAKKLAVLASRPDSPHRSLFNIGIGADPKDPTRYCVSVRSGGLGLPDKSYYFADSFAAIRTQYVTYIATLLQLANWPEAEARAREVMAFETRLAEASWDRAELRNRDRTYNPMSPEELASRIEGYPVQDVLTELGLAEVERLVVGDDSAFPPKATIFRETSLDTLKAWMASGLIDQMADYLSEPFVRTKFEFRSKTLAGQPEAPARWKMAVTTVNNLLGEEVGKIYVARYFSPESKQQMLELVGNVRKVLSVRIDALDWMGEDTKKAAQEKLAKFNVKIGYPEKFPDYSAYEVRKDDLVGNIRRSAHFEWQRRLSRLNDPVDRSEWHMPPQRVNAYYSSVMNEIVFPAAILQPPFFDPEADPAVNYGGIGGVIGHEIIHGFDDQGRKSDGDGRLKGWWSDADDERFSALAQKLGAQYEASEILPGHRINPSLTMGENIADLGGLTLALEAYRLSLGGKAAPVIDGFSGEQRLFLSWAQIWRQKIRNEALVKQINTDPHSPGIARVNFVLRNIDAWYDAFDVKPGDKLYLEPADRVKIW